MQEKDIKRLVDLHLTNLVDSNLNKLGEKFLHNLYGYLSFEKNIYIYLLPQGFLIGKVGPIRFNMKNPYFFKFGWQVLRHLIALRGTFSVESFDDPEIQFLAVSEKFRGHGFGTKLVRNFSKAMKDKKFKTIIVGTKSKNKKSNKFYRKIGFKPLKNKEYFGEKFNYWIFYLQQ